MKNKNNFEEDDINTLEILIDCLKDITDDFNSKIDPPLQLIEEVNLIITKVLKRIYKPRRPNINFSRKNI